MEISSKSSRLESSNKLAFWNEKRCNLVLLHRIFFFLTTKVQSAKSSGSQKYVYFRGLNAYGFRICKPLRCWSIIAINIISNHTSGEIPTLAISSISCPVDLICSNSLVTFSKSRSLIFVSLVTLPATNTPVHSSTGATFWSSVLRWEIHRASKNCNVEKTDLFLDLFDIIGLTYA